jgi:hypothetical protein
VSRILTLIALALATAAVAAPVAGADRGTRARTTVDPLAVSYLSAKGLTPSEVQSWTVGVCSHEAKDASCYAMLDSTAAAVDPLAVSYLSANGLTPGIGAAATLGIVFLLGALGAALLSRHNRRPPMARA